MSLHGVILTLKTLWSPSLCQAGPCGRPVYTQPSQAGMAKWKSLTLRLEGLSNRGLSRADINTAPHLNTRNEQMKILNMLNVSWKGIKIQWGPTLSQGRLQNNSPNDFCKGIKRMNNSKTSLPTDVDGVIGSEETTQLRQKHHYELFNNVTPLRWAAVIVMKMRPSPYEKSFNAVMMLKGMWFGQDIGWAFSSKELQSSACNVVEFYLILFYLSGQYLLSKTKLAK